MTSVGAPTSTASVDQEQLRAILIQLVADVLRDKPDDVIEYMSTWATSHDSERQMWMATIEEKTEALRSLARQYMTKRRGSAKNSTYHYMMALEDSDYDLFHLQKLQRSAAAARAEEAQARKEEKELEDALQRILESQCSPHKRATELEQLYESHKEQWQTAQ